MGLAGRDQGSLEGSSDLNKYQRHYIHKLMKCHKFILPEIRMVSFSAGRNFLRGTEEMGLGERTFLGD